MGCPVSYLQQSAMSLFGRNSNNDTDDRVKVERKLYLAKISPEPDFDLSDCQLQQVPSGIYSICKVYRKERLYLHENNLRSLDEGGFLSDLYMIKILNLNCNKFSKLPNDIRYLTNLTELYIQDNHLKCLPETIQYLENLQILDVSKNRLRNLTPSLGRLRNLRKLVINENEDLHELCPELCLATNLILIDLDVEQFKFPPPEIASEGTTKIMEFLCKKLNVVYNPSLVSDTDITPIQSPVLTPDLFTKVNTISWEEQEAAIKEQEIKMHQAAKEQREKFLNQFVQDQIELDAEIAKVHEARDVERQKLLKVMQEDEKEIACLIQNFIQSDNLNPEVIQQQLAYEQAEHDRLLEIIRQNYDNIKEAEVLKAMESLIEEDCYILNSKRQYEDSLKNVQQNMLTQELENNERFKELLKTKDQTRSVLVQQLLEDQIIQKAIVASLLEKVDAKSWSLNQEIHLISSRLARLSVIEQEKKKLQVDCNYNELLHQRIHLVNLLNDLFDQQTKRRNQLTETLKEMERQTDKTTHYWLMNYQKLMNSAPKTLLDIGKNLDPIFANYLLQEGVIHCLPFLVRFIFSDESLTNITTDDLKESGVSLSSDRDGILRAINYYVTAKNNDYHFDKVTSLEPSAPPVPIIDEQKCTGIVNSNEVDNSTSDSECVICMNEKCEVVFIPCGHMCCCQTCSENDMALCPMCRGAIERKIRVRIA